MSKETTKPTTPESSLSKFNLGFEYDRTWQDVKREIRARTQK